MDDLIQRLKDFRDNLPTIIGEAATLVSGSAKAIAERRIKESGFNESYSDAKYPAWFLIGEELNQAGLSFLKTKKENDEPTNWAELRESQGLQSAHVDLSYSNEMWSGMQPQEPYELNGAIVAPLAHTNTAGQRKMNYNFERYGDFIGKVLNEEDMEMLAEIAIEYIAKKI